MSFENIQSPDHLSTSAGDSEGVTNALAELVTALRQQNQDELKEVPADAAGQLHLLVSAVNQAVEQMRASLAEVHCLKDEINAAIDQSRTQLAQWRAASPPTREKPLVAPAPASPSCDANIQNPSAWESQKAALLKSYAVANGDQAAAITVPEVSPADIAETAAGCDPLPTAESCPADGQTPAELPDDVADLRLEWKEKLRQAEIEISIERAKIARMESELELKLSEVDQKLKANKRRTSDARGKDKNKFIRRLSRFLPQSDEAEADSDESSPV